jgi:myo-inositol-1(or 4)-monophosphatase
MITEAGGLVGNFTGEADFLYQRELVAGNPKVYGQLVKILAPYTRILPEPDAAAAPAPAAAADATAAFVEGAAPAPARKAVRIRKAGLPPALDAPF